MAALTEEQMRELDETFDVLDMNHDGGLDFDEVAKIIRAIGANPTQTEIQEMFDEIDVNGSGTIDKEEFRDWISANGNKYIEMDLDTKMKAAFAIFDQDDSGKISKQELERIMKNLGDEPLSEEEWNTFMSEIDTDGDGQINYEEFIPVFAAVAGKRESHSEEY